MASYWTRKDDQSGETATIYPWQEKIGGGDKEFPEPLSQRCCQDSSSQVYGLRQGYPPRRRRSLSSYIISLLAFTLFLLRQHQIEHQCQQEDDCHAIIGKDRAYQFGEDVEHLAGCGKA